MTGRDVSGSVCVYCGAYLSSDEVSGDVDHWRSCPDHPARKLTEELRIILSPFSVDTLDSSSINKTLGQIALEKLSKAWDLLKKEMER